MRVLAMWVAYRVGVGNGQYVRYWTQKKMMSRQPEVGWKWLKWTFGVWSDPANRTFFGIDLGPLEIVWHMPGYRP